MEQDQLADHWQAEPTRKENMGKVYEKLANNNFMLSTSIYRNMKHVSRLAPIVATIISFCSMQLFAQTNVPKEFPVFYKEGHRGGTGLAPENTIPAMIRGIEAGANVIEVDVYTSKDGQVIITHDPHINWKISLTKEGNELTEEEAKKYPVHQMSYDEIRKFDVGFKPYPAFPGQKKIKTYIPLLGELIDSVEHYTTTKKLPKVIYNIELKTSPAFDSIYNSKPEELVDAVMSVVKSKKIGDRFYIQSFDKRPLQYAHRKYPDVTIGFLVSNTSTFDENIQQLGFVPHIYSPAFKLLTPELVQQCKSKKSKLVVWTVNTREDMKRIKGMGVDGIITDYPNYLSELD
jgi:glycerophosphoryl diester phosphodiesterase